MALIATSAVTHSVNYTQRFVEIDFAVAADDRLIALAPPNGNTAPPGYYMLFILNQRGVPAIAEFLQLGDPDPDTTTPIDFNAFRGFYDSGDLDSLLESDDDKLCYNPGITLSQTEAPITLDFTGTLPTDSPASLDVTIESAANTVGLELTISFWNYNTNSWDVVGVAGQSLNDDMVRTFAGVPADHVEPGTGEVRTRYEVRVVSFIFVFPWLDCVDHVFWTTTN